MEKKIKEEEIKTFLNSPYDKLDAILEIEAGAGGRDAQDWATLLLKMYQKFCQKKGFKTEILYQSFGEPGPEGRIGTKKVALLVKGRWAYGILKKERGVHRLIRISPFSAQKLRHTSFALVEVIPVLPREEREIQINPGDLKIETFRASGPGGQYVNRRESAVRITHLPTGIVVSCQSERTQAQNKENALAILRARLLYLQQEKEKENIQKLRKSQIGKMERSEKIRTYNFPQDRITDHRIKKTWHNLEEILSGKLDPLIEELEKSKFNFN